MRYPVQHSEPVANIIDEIHRDFSAKVPKNTSEAVDANFGERT
jgi:hypothetical protein